MTKNPIVNALAAAVYIALVGSLLYYLPQAVGKINSAIGPIALISLFTLSAAVMGYVFLLKPAQLYLDGEKKEAVSLLLTTIAAFAVFTVLLVLGILVSTS